MFRLAVLFFLFTFSLGQINTLNFSNWHYLLWLITAILCVLAMIFVFVAEPRMFHRDVPM